MGKRLIFSVHSVVLLKVIKPSILIIASVVVMPSCSHKMAAGTAEAGPGSRSAKYGLGVLQLCCLTWMRRVVAGEGCWGPSGQ